MIALTKRWQAALQVGQVDNRNEMAGWPQRLPEIEIAAVNFVRILKVHTKGKGMSVSEGGVRRGTDLSILRAGSAGYRPHIPLPNHTT